MGVTYSPLRTSKIKALGFGRFLGQEGGMELGKRTESIIGISD